MFKYDKPNYIRAAELKSKGLTYAEIGAELNVSKQRAQQLCRPPEQVYDMLKKRSGEKCERCGIGLSRGHAHHIRYGLDRWNLADLLYLCTSCHITWHQPKTTVKPERTMPKNAAAVALGRLGGMGAKGVVSEAKKASSRANVAKARAALAARKEAHE